MEREYLDRLLAEYATGGLSAEEKQVLFTAALGDQELFDQLMEEDSLREAVALPGARDRLIDSLQEEVVEMPLVASGASLLRRPAPAAAAPKQAPQRPMWLAWAAGIGVVFVSGAISYVLLDRGEITNMARVRTSEPRETKPFVPPPSVVTPQRAQPVVVEEPPKIMTENRAPLAATPTVNIPLPTAPPPPAAALEAMKVAKAADSVAGGTAPAEPRVAQLAPMPASAARGVVAGNGRREVLATPMALPPTVWRRTVDGVWIRVPVDDFVSRNETVAIRYVPGSTATVTIRDERGQLVVQKNGRTGEEVELVVSSSALAGAGTGVLALTLAEEPQTQGVIGGIVSRKAAVPPTIKINLRVR